MADHRHHGEGEHHQRNVAMPPMPFTSWRQRSQIWGLCRRRVGSLWWLGSWTKKRTRDAQHSVARIRRPPITQPPSRRGFGTTLIERTLSHEFDAIVKREFLPSGLRRSIDMPTTAEVIYVAPRKHSIDRAFDVAGCRVLVVEGETLIALLIEETLEAMECKIVGPAAKLEIALQLALDGEFDIAILDITVRGGKFTPCPNNFWREAFLLY